MLRNDAMASHVIWKLRLKRLIHDESGETPEIGIISRVDLCDLGKWTQSEGLKYKTTVAYQRLMNEHDRFHALAAKVVGNIKAGNTTDAETILEGPLEEASRAIVSAIAELQEETIQI